MLVASVAIHALIGLTMNSRAIAMSLPFRMNVANAALGLLMIGFGAALASWRANTSALRGPLGVFYVLQGLILVSTIALPLRLLELTIAIRIVEAAWFRQRTRAHAADVDAPLDLAHQPVL
jgi:hypothetical protein